MITHFNLTLPPFPRGFHLITKDIRNALPGLPAAGLLHLFIQHTGAGLAINENADPTVRMDFETIFNRLIPEDRAAYRHNAEGPDDMPAHVKSTLTGCHLTIPVVNGQLGLGTWQGIYLCEFRNEGGSRKLVLTLHT